MKTTKRLIDKKIENKKYLSVLAKVINRTPGKIKKELNFNTNRFKVQIMYLEAINKIEGKDYTIYDLFIKKQEDE